MVGIFKPRDPAQLNAVKAMLEGEGIKTYVSEQPLAPTTLMVMDEDAGKAVKLIEEYLSNVAGLDAPQANAEGVKLGLLEKVNVWWWVLWIVGTLFFFVRGCS